MAFRSTTALRVLRSCLLNTRPRSLKWSAATARSLNARQGLRKNFASVSDSERFTVTPRRYSPTVESRLPMVQDNKILVFSDISNRYVALSDIWLRDNCHCPKCFHEVTKQRVIETFDDIPPDIAITRAGIQESQDGFTITWNDGHQSFYNNSWLAESGLKRKPRSQERLAIAHMKFWDGESIKRHPPTVEYEIVISSDDGVKDWLTNIRKFGFSYVNNCPATPEASEKLLKRIAFIRNTHYGGFYDFTADLSSGDTAYTQLGIGAHTDNTYFSDPAGLQMFHLLSHTNGSGGASQLVDGFGAAADLLQQDPEAYHTLATWRVHCHASGGNDISIQPCQAFPVLCHDPQDGFLVQVRWNTTDRAAIDAPIEDMEKWYDAARKWASILRKREYWEQLQPGKPLIFDNWRVLHGRSEFTGNRRMCGGYINRDDWISRFRLLNKGREEVLQEISRG